MSKGRERVRGLSGPHPESTDVILQSVRERPINDGLSLSLVVGRGYTVPNSIHEMSIIE